MPVTRSEIADAVGGAFASGGADRETLLMTAETEGARPEVLAALRELPARRFSGIRDLWAHLPDIPMEA